MGIDGLFHSIPLGIWILITVIALSVIIWVFKSVKKIGNTERGWITKNFGKKLPEGALIALNGEAGPQPDPKMPGLRFVLWPIYSIKKEPLVQVPQDGFGVVIAQTGD